MTAAEAGLCGLCGDPLDRCECNVPAAAVESLKAAADARTEATTRAASAVFQLPEPDGPKKLLVHYLPPPCGPVTFADRLSVPIIACRPKKPVQRWTRDVERVTCKACREAARLATRRRAA